MKMIYFAILPLLLICVSAQAASIPPFEQRLPMEVVFKGGDKFQRLVKQAQRENWATLPIGERTARVGKALLGTPYVNYTLEIHDRIESPSVNFQGLDCWTFYEISLAFARMLRLKPGDYTPEDLLALVELERYLYIPQKKATEVFLQIVKNGKTFPNQSPGKTSYLNVRQLFASRSRLKSPKAGLQPPYNPHPTRQINLPRENKTRKAPTGLRHHL
jgi:hypothetical protein